MRTVMPTNFSVKFNISVFEENLLTLEGVIF